ncbi:hypothetical protein [Blastococcus saxobsidens]|uniref:Uncharacterized protein n=1 Tax=Blastococcus saxobsidens (strain DD2) TaxID=1146883 RepID=H6RT47_BLASD|nr:hypothetical protein [Blastococcus saxobsidens]CCG04350.1 protein of unknown function [Blastococcus saxobsidens DD2]
MEFILDGVTHSLDAATVPSVLRDVDPEPVRERWIDIDGVRWLPKQVLALATGLDRADFTSHRDSGFSSASASAPVRGVEAGSQPDQGGRRLVCLPSEPAARWTSA